jgi:hypothetical protein
MARAQLGVSAQVVNAALPLLPTSLAAQGSNPLALLLAAREAAFEAAMARASTDHERALARLRAAMAAAASDERLQVR